MSNQEFLQAKLKAFKPEFKQLVGLKKSPRTSELLDFMRMLHPNQPRVAQGSSGSVFGRKHFVFTIYTTGVLRTTKATGTRIFYPCAVRDI